jgi:hypothetical protein
VKIVFGAGHVEGSKTYLGYTEDIAMFDLANRKVKYVTETYKDIEAVSLKITSIANGYDGIQTFIHNYKANLCSLEHSNADDSINEEPNEINRVVVYRTVKNPGDGPCRPIGQACADVLGTSLAAIQHRANSSGGDWYGAIKRAMSAGCSDAWLTEHGFHTNAACRAKLSDPDIRQRLAEKEVDAMAAYYKWKKKEVDTMLKVGSKGDAVRSWQYCLLKSVLSTSLGTSGPNDDGIDGDFAAKTQAATIEIANRLGLTGQDFVDDVLWGLVSRSFADKQSGITQSMLDEQKAKADAALANVKVLQDAVDGYKVTVANYASDLSNVSKNIKEIIGISNKY